MASRMSEGSQISIPEFRGLRRSVSMALARVFYSTRKRRSTHFGSLGVEELIDRRKWAVRRCKPNSSSAWTAAPPGAGHDSASRSPDEAQRNRWLRADVPAHAGTSIRRAPRIPHSAPLHAGYDPAGGRMTDLDVRMAEEVRQAPQAVHRQAQILARPRAGPAARPQRRPPPVGRTRAQRTPAHA